MSVSTAITAGVPMPALTHGLWAFLVLLGTVVLAHIAGVINPDGKVNGLWLVAAAGL